MIACYNGATSRPYPLEEDLRAVSAAGFPMVELWGEKFEKYFATYSVDGLKGLLERYQLRHVVIPGCQECLSQPAILPHPRVKATRGANI